MNGMYGEDHKANDLLKPTIAELHTAIDLLVRMNNETEIRVPVLSE